MKNPKFDIIYKLDRHPKPVFRNCKIFSQVKQK